MIQNVCVDDGGAVLPGRSPLDPSRLCPKQRDIEPGDRLPYHKHDHPSPDHARDLPLGYQRHDSVPVATAGLGIVVEHSFDFGPPEGRRFGAFDRGSDGGDVVILSPGSGFDRRDRRRRRPVRPVGRRMQRHPHRRGADAFLAHRRVRPVRRGAAAGGNRRPAQRRVGRRRRATCPRRFNAALHALAGRAVPLPRRAGARRAGHLVDADLGPLRRCGSGHRRSCRALLFRPRTRRHPMGAVAERQGQQEVRRRADRRARGRARRPPADAARPSRRRAPRWS